MISNFRKKNIIIIVILAVVLCVTAFLALRYGSVYMGLGEFVGALADKGSTFNTILFSIRLPRVLAAIFAGVGLSVSGVLLQTVTDNPLASPNIIGVNAGAGFAVIVCLSFLPAFPFLIPIGAFGGALIATFLIVFLASRLNNSKITVVLAGIAFTAILNAGISLISLIDTDILTSYNYFSIGGFSGVNMEELYLPMALIIISLILSLLLSSKANTLMLGDDIAYSLGINVKVLRTSCLIVASLSAASVVSYCGLLGFVGLVVPHIARKIIGSNMKNLIIVSSLTGAILVIISDLLGRVLFAPSELPVGIIMSLIGAPFFFFLLLKGRGKGNA